MKISVVICTHNRGDILSYCLDSLAKQSADKSLYEVLIVDNNSTDSTEKIVGGYLKRESNFRYIKEFRIGLSHARNTGYHEAKADWVFYIDDDAKAFPNLIERAIWAIDKEDFDCIGGNYIAWHLYDKPKWLPANYGDSRLLRNTFGLIENGYATGCVMLLKKETLILMGGFDLKLGMNGKKIAYGEETFLQKKMRERGSKIAFDPELMIEHLVGKHKLTVKWHLNSIYASSRDHSKMFPKKDSNYSLEITIKTIIKSLIKVIPASIIKFVKTKDYYWQNFVIDILKPIYSNWGRYETFKTTHFRR